MKKDIFADPVRTKEAISISAGLALAYVLVQSIRYSMEQADRDTDALGQFTEAIATEGTPLHEAAEKTPIGPLVQGWDVITGQQTPGEAAKDWYEGEIEKGKKITGWLGL